jgi:hypothetical protein
MKESKSTDRRLSNFGRFREGLGDGLRGAVRSITLAAYQHQVSLSCSKSYPRSLSRSFSRLNSLEKNVSEEDCAIRSNEDFLEILSSSFSSLKTWE